MNLLIYSNLLQSRRFIELLKANKEKYKLINLLIGAKIEKGS